MASSTGLAKCILNRDLPNSMSFFSLGVKFHHTNQGRDSACSPVLLCLGAGHRVLKNGRQIR